MQRLLIQSVDKLMKTVLKSVGITPDLNQGRKFLSQLVTFLKILEEVMSFFKLLRTLELGPVNSLSTPQAIKPAATAKEESLIISLILLPI